MQSGPARFFHPSLEWFRTRLARHSSTEDFIFAAVVGLFTILAARIWWISEIVPAQDYPQFLVFVRAVHDHRDPTSPFHGTYTTLPWFTPTGLPVHLTSLLSYLCGGSIEAAGKLLLTLQNVGLVAATIYLLRTLGRSRWAVVLVFPLIHSEWTVVGGFASYATALPLVVLSWALAVRWLQRNDVRSGAELALCLCVTLLWHGIAYSQAGFAFAVLWFLWRAPSWRARLLGVVPTLPSLLQYAAWTWSVFGKQPRDSGGPEWLPAWQAADSVFDFVWACVPHRSSRAVFLATLVAAGMAISAVNLSARGPTARLWRVRNPFLVVSGLYLIAYFVLPINMVGVAGFSNRFPYVAALAFIFAWNLPAPGAARALLVAVMLAFSFWCLDDLSDRFRAFQRDTHGASELIDRLAVHETLYFYPGPDRGFYPEFGPSNKAMIELEQFATARRGGLPNSSFAGYGYTYVVYEHNRNPMPGLYGPPTWSQEMTKFDYVLVRATQALTDPRFRLVDGRAGWELYGVCGSRRFPTCG